MSTNLTGRRILALALSLSAPAFATDGVNCRAITVTLEGAARSDRFGGHQ